MPKLGDIEEVKVIQADGTEVTVRLKVIGREVKSTPTPEAEPVPTPTPEAQG